ncbi:MAG: hypothetical protein HETSPECPRED_008475 [Heterodermia speciosa]|uniref:Heterokaryon incompatibility domain-containing protein n=1 Tax=Heterodermia speciosa TaxID=116794 RepID=A0A8H3FYB4_9LECA|nr:MAG: hypothetical protein HETSPECPRED_008475 [Heterodermia speciosa]
MEHLPLPHNSPFPPIRVPYIGSPLFDSESWQDFPQRHGWQVIPLQGDTLFLLHGERRPIEETAGLLQSWLFFGLLQSTLGDLYDANDFVSEREEGIKVLSTERLESRLHQWTIRNALEPDLTALRQQLDKHYKIMVAHRTISVRMHLCGLDLGNASIMLSIALLGERLQAALMDIYSHCKLETPVSQVWRLFGADHPDIGKPVLDLMQARGWCLYDLNRLKTQAGLVSILCYYSNIPPPRSSRDHSNCTGERCLAMTTVPDTYKLSHSHEGCDCPLLFADENEVIRTLLDGSIPLVRIASDTRSKSPQMSIEPFVHADPFIAISHVWAEGAGNVQANALHSCLLHEISSLVRKLPGHAEQRATTFWIDTICVPVRPPDMQTLALNKMREPYEQASSVLVLDAHLRSLISKNLSPTELLAQVACSSWMRRLWTLQEGRLAKKVWFQFADMAVNVKEGFDNVDHTRVPTRVDFWLQTEIYVQLWMQIWWHSQVIRNTSRVAGMISSTRLALSSRSVSVPTDEVLCLFCLMGMDMTRITSVPPADRMQVFWRQFEKVPIGFLFSRAPDKIAQRGLHWAPISFLGPQSEKEWLGPQDLSSPGPDDPHGIVTDSGLSCALPGLTLHPGLIQRMQDFQFTWKFDLMVQDEDDRWLAVRIESTWAQIPIDSVRHRQLAIILAHSVPEEGTSIRLIGQNSGTFSAGGTSVGVIVSIVRSEGEVLFVEAHNHVVVEHLSEGLQRYFSSAKACANEADTPHLTLVSESHEMLKERFKPIAERLMKNEEYRSLLANKARHFGTEDTYEMLLEDLLDTAVVNARFGDYCRVHHVATSQQWCVD